MKASELEAEFADMNGWDAEPEAERLLNGLGIEPDKHHKKMADLTDKEKVRLDDPWRVGVGSSSSSDETRYFAQLHL